MTAYRSGKAWSRNRRRKNGLPDVLEYYADQSALVREAVEDQEAQVAEAVAEVREESDNYEPTNDPEPEPRYCKHLELLQYSEAELLEILEGIPRDELFDIWDDLMSFDDNPPEIVRLIELVDGVLNPFGNIVDDPWSE